MFCSAIPSHFKKMSDEKNNETQDPEKSADADNGVKVPEKFKKLVEEIQSLSVLDLAELVKVLEKKFGVSAAVPLAMVGAPAAGGAEAKPEEEKTIFNVELKSAGEQKINVIKAIREVTALGLKEAKDLVDGAPKLVKEGVKKEEAEKIKQKLEAVGATVEIK